ncbi:immunoglobulin I-set domain protein [Pedosphaera parvula]|uniref:Immunoglobulin I-set domain protein n=1 Tax=Pedosphaera parvula (strain Ellin514) TaxID=320771 RepID=B9XAF1_PEDPL|nr:immunoglobulin I-set domain protein [Pedosphaera parvula]EEF62986.1 immunoglobulin I-set domain protein [Pedosphaera parvula Ellin514]
MKLLALLRRQACWHWNVFPGSFHSLFLKSDGSLWATGGNYYGELRDGTYTVNAPYGINQPEQIVGSNVTSIASGAFHSLFLMNDGSLWGMGLNQNGELGGDVYNEGSPFVQREQMACALAEICNRNIGL